MLDCPFCQIVAGEKPNFRVYEDANFLAFLDINPVVEGHTLVIPKKHHQWLWEIEVPGFFMATQKVSRMILKGLNVPFVSYLSMGLQAPHAHLHIIPRKIGDGLFVFEGKDQLASTPLALSVVANKIIGQ
jgi:histidine triad (HIT) family protein